MSRFCGERNMGSESNGYVVGIDAGGTTTRCWAVTASSRLIGSSQGGPGNLYSVGLNTLTQRVVDLVRSALPGPYARQRAQALCLGASGVGRSDEVAAVRDALQSARLAQQVLVVNDGQIALAAGTLGQPGVALIAGTGSLALGQAADGKQARAGGWGYLLGDEGSGYAIGRDALTAVLRAHDGRQSSTSLSIPLQRALGLQKPEDVIKFTYARPFRKEQIAALAPLVAEVAATGDTTATGILTKAGTDLALMAAAVHRRLDLSASAPIVRVGGLFRLGPLLLDPFISALQELRPGTHSAALPWEPVLGAVYLALRSMGVSLTVVQAEQLTEEEAQAAATGVHHDPRCRQATILT